MLVDKEIQKRKKVKSKKRIVIISDTHITPTGTNFNLHAFEKGMEKVNKIKDVDIFLHLGDITDTGTLLDYEYALDLYKQFKPVSKAPLYYLIGNHDALNVGYLLFEEILGERHFEYEDESLYIIGIDSTKPDLPGGVIHHNTIEAIRKRLVAPERKDKIKVVCFHHQLIPIPNTGKERSAIDDSGNMLRMLLETKADLVLNGHRHISNLYTVSSTQKNLYIFNSGTFCCNKTRYRELFTYNILEIENNTLHFRIIPTLERSLFTKQINRTINYYHPREIKSDEEPYCKFIQLSNSLISEEASDKVTNFDKALKEINMMEDIDLVVHAGNLTSNSYEQEFKIAKEKLNKIKFPYLAVPGFTDSKPPAWQFWDKYLGDLNPLFENDKIYFRGINSTTPDSKIGFVGRKKLHKFIEKVLTLSHEKIFGICCFHSLIPTPLSVWRTELTDAGDVLSQIARSRIGLVLNNTPSISFNVKVENSIISNGGNLKGDHFNAAFIEITIYKDGYVILTEHDLDTGKKRNIGKYNITILT
ncbi:MAG: metallophosphoesterase [Promethearchaeota archaeon]|nr:MAG: metallophosphoesterase [Candidatus Lokiarchaeota archaeon]